MTYSISDLAYCTNVHVGESIQEINLNLDRFVGPVRERLGAANLGAGLWVSNSASQALNDLHLRSGLQQHLLTNRLSLRSINGFPFSNFHNKVVKESVYLPDWSCTSRLTYTISLANLLAQCLYSDDQKGTISTLPLGFKKGWGEKKHSLSLTNLLLLVIELKLIEENTGKHIQVCLEMEPACVLEETPQLVSFYANDLEKAAGMENIPIDDVYRYLGVCYDVCHQAVMFEDIASSMLDIKDNGISIGKVQLSSALLIESDNIEDIKKQLGDFAEPRYLHQTSIKMENGELSFYSDLSHALQNTTHSGLQQWRVHYHVPLQLEKINENGLTTTRFATDEVFCFLAANREVKPYLEVETYTWSVLPEAIRPNGDESLISGIEAELQYVKRSLIERNLLRKDII